MLLKKKISHETEQQLQQDKSLIAKIQPQGEIAFNGEKLITTGDGYEIINGCHKRLKKYSHHFLGCTASE